MIKICERCRKPILKGIVSKQRKYCGKCAIIEKKEKTKKWQYDNGIGLLQQLPPKVKGEVRKNFKQEKKRILQECIDNPGKYLEEV